MESTLIKIEEAYLPRPTKPRTKCPFYGFRMSNGVMGDSGSNQCGLVINMASPCHMEFEEGDFPNWNACPLNTVERRGYLDMVADSTKVFPYEFCIKKAVNGKAYR